MSEAEQERSFGPSAILTPANAITIARLLLAPVAFVMIVRQESSWALFVLWVVITTTDSLDGYLARKQGTTRSGAFLDHWCSADQEGGLYKGHIDTQALYQRSPSLSLPQSLSKA